ncbi:o-succinylbenzoate--CoA ligase [Thaumasiovibrio subtropicus]|uniref:o-succinylbenzoate--CoA ligase n=1 Tax=Thaumasiovibrio subtropicus TaxID=1891207 RepID=UPI000B35B194|nr:o-succinylbenzoate--CoA ligase [Thaumasiovibrio subtropicus]
MLQFDTYPWRQYAAQKPDTVALQQGDKRVTWIQLCQHVTAWRHWLATQPSQAPLVVASQNRVELIYLLLAASESHRTLLITHPQLPDAEKILKHLGAGAILDVDHFDPFERQGATKHAPLAWDENQPLTLTLTSGSTGIPKAVVHSAATHLAAAKGVLSKLPFTADNDWLLSLPLFHISGLAIVWRWLSCGAILTLPEDEVLDALRHVSHASLVPTQLQRFLASGGSHQLQQVLLGGAAIPVDLVQKATQQGIACWCGYGMTEMGSTVMMKPADNKPGVGALLPHRRMQWRDNEIWLAGASLCLGYYREGVIDPVVNQQGWFATKDLAQRADDEWQIIGRKDNMFISGGENVQPESIEAALSSVAGITRVMVLPIDDSDYGQRPIAIVEGHWDRKILEAWVKKYLPGHMRPVDFVAWPTDMEMGIKVPRRIMLEWLKNK